MLRLLVTPRWLVRHVLLIAALVTCWYLGRWQFYRAIERDSLLNWSYTVEWFLFAGFSLLSWGWFLRDDLRGEPEDGEPDPAVPVPVPVPRPVAPPLTDEDDPELAEYNRMLAALHDKDSS
jgi:hypothetical protein